MKYKTTKMLTVWMKEKAYYSLDKKKRNALDLIAYPIDFQRIRKMPKEHKVEFKILVSPYDFLKKIVGVGKFELIKPNGG